MRLWWVRGSRTGEQVPVNKGVNCEPRSRSQPAPPHAESEPDALGGTAQPSDQDPDTQPPSGLRLHPPSFGAPLAPLDQGAPFRLWGLPGNTPVSPWPPALVTLSPQNCLSQDCPLALTTAGLLDLLAPGLVFQDIYVCFTF